MDANVSRENASDTIIDIDRISHAINALYMPSTDEIYDWPEKQRKSNFQEPFEIPVF